MKSDRQGEGGGAASGLAGQQREALVSKGKGQGPLVSRFTHSAEQLGLSVSNNSPPPPKSASSQNLTNSSLMNFGLAGMAAQRSQLLHLQWVRCPPLSPRDSLDCMGIATFFGLPDNSACTQMYKVYIGVSKRPQWGSLRHNSSNPSTSTDLHRTVARGAMVEDLSRPVLPSL